MMDPWRGNRVGTRPVAKDAQAGARSAKISNGFNLSGT